MTRSSFRSTTGWPAFRPGGRVYLRGLVLAAFAALVALIGTQTPVMAHPTTITLSASYGHPGATVKVSGAGFDSYEAVDIYFDTTDEALTTTSSAGTFSNVPITAPATALPGPHYITGVGRHSGRAAQAEFDVYTDWTQEKFDRRHKSYNPYENVVGPGNVASLDLDWAYQTGITGDFVDEPLVVADGIAYGLSYEGQIFAIDTTTGSAVWTVDISAGGGGVAVSDGVVFVCQYGGEVAALNASNGQTIWSINPPAGCATNPTIANGVLYFADTDGNAYAEEASSGVQIWVVPIGGNDATPVVGNGLVFINSFGTNTVYALNASTGATAWNYAGSTFFNDLTLASGVLYASSNDGNLYAIDPAQGYVLWQKNPGLGALEGLAVAPAGYYGTLVYVGTGEGYEAALSATNGDVVWKTNISGESNGALTPAPVVANGVVYVSNQGTNYVYALDSSYGNLYWSAQTDQGYPDLVLTNGMLFASTNAYALNGGNDRAYKQHRSPPKISSLHPDYSLKPQAGTP